MMRIIEGKRYNTETAEKIVDWSNSYPPGDFKRCAESLYRTKKGNWFLAGEGGPMSKYAEPVGDMTGGGSGIIPLTDQDALQWLEDKEFVDEIEAYFSESIDDA
ncbi:MAG: hypothetical protein SWC96_03925 [Thermodesulfobacteriota bacterium]|nr:hypothetical protein [Thermodesulfobacteriota bacterium]